jgi:hypothetical protein
VCRNLTLWRRLTYNYRNVPMASGASEWQRFNVGLGPGLRVPGSSREFVSFGWIIRGTFRTYETPGSNLCPQLGFLIPEDQSARLFSSFYPQEVSPRLSIMTAQPIPDHSSSSLGTGVRSGLMFRWRIGNTSTKVLCWDPPSPSTFVPHAAAPARSC